MGPNCYNKELIDSKIYANIWHDLAQELPAEQISKYNIICLLDVIEHLDKDSAVWFFLRTLLTFMSDEACLFISTPLWFFSLDQNQIGDLEEHLIGVPITSMLALNPYKFAFTEPLIGGFILGKRSLDYIDLFLPTTNKKFEYDKGMNLLKTVNLDYKCGIVYNTQ